METDIVKNDDAEIKQKKDELLRYLDMINDVHKLEILCACAQPMVETDKK